MLQWFMGTVHNNSEPTTVSRNAGLAIVEAYTVSSPEWYITLSSMYQYVPIVEASLIPRPHPLTRRNGLVNQVEFLGLARTFATVSPSNVQNILRPTCSKKVRILEWKWTNFTVVSEVLCNNYPISQSHWSLPLLGNKPKEFDFVHQTVARREARWAGHETKLKHTQSAHQSDITLSSMYQ